MPTILNEARTWGAVIGYRSSCSIKIFCISLLYSMKKTIANWNCRIHVSYLIKWQSFILLMHKFVTAGNSVKMSVLREHMLDNWKFHSVKKENGKNLKCYKIWDLTYSMHACSIFIVSLKILSLYTKLACKYQY